MSEKKKHPIDWEKYDKHTRLIANTALVIAALGFISFISVLAEISSRLQ